MSLVWLSSLLLGPGSSALLSSAAAVGFSILPVLCVDVQNFHVVLADVFFFVFSLFKKHNNKKKNRQFFFHLNENFPFALMISIPTLNMSI